MEISISMYVAVPRRGGIPVRLRFLSEIPMDPIGRGREREKRERREEGEDQLRGLSRVGQEGGEP